MKKLLGSVVLAGAVAATAVTFMPGPASAQIWTYGYDRGLMSQPGGRDWAIGRNAYRQGYRMGRGGMYGGDYGYNPNYGYGGGANWGPGMNPNLGYGVNRTSPGGGIYDRNYGMGVYGGGYGNGSNYAYGAGYGYGGAYGRDYGYGLYGEDEEVWTAGDLSYGFGFGDGWFD